MPRDTLVDFFEDFAALDGEFLVHDDGYRGRTYSYRDVAAAARGFAARLHAAGLRKGDALLLWGENRPEWIAAFWGCVLVGVVVVPIDHRSSLAFARRVRGIVQARVAFVADSVAADASGEAGSPACLDDAQTWPMSEFDWHDLRRPPAVPLVRDDLAEIIFTSGSTGDPKGVLITHRNVLANIVPVEREVLKYRRWGRPFFPLRFLDLLPLSHMFGQAMATFIPPMLPGTTVFMRGVSPAEIVAQVKKHRVSVVVSVPKILDVLRGYVERTVPGAAEPPARREHVILRWWRYRRVHRAFGPKFWSFVVGAAPLDPALEAFWSRLGFLVIQGYGLTETAPIVSLNHPFGARSGSVGKPIAGVEVRIARDGEILVRGENVTRGYVGAEPVAGEAFEDGWLRTGDIGELDEQGRLFVRGRKKEVIVTPEGLNVFPEDVERVLNRQPGVRDSAVVGVKVGSEERVHAVLLVGPHVETGAVVGEANRHLADHQRIRSYSAWPDADFPRTEGTGKLKRGEVRQWVETGDRRQSVSTGAGTLEALLAQHAGGRALRPETTIDELGLSSLERVELMVAIEERLRTDIDEAQFAAVRSVGDLQSLVADHAGASGATGSGTEAWTMPTWPLGWIARAVRRVSLAVWLLPLARLVARIRVDGADRLDGIEGPVVFASNHQSHLDTPVILAALPARWRYRLSVAMAKEFFDAYFHPEGRALRERWLSGAAYGLASLFFNAFPLPQREAGARRTLRHVGDLITDGWSLLIYPEGERTTTGAVGTFRAGVGMIGSRLSVPVVPVGLEGVDRVLHRSWRMARPGRVRVSFGEPMWLKGDHYAELAARVEHAVRELVTR